MVPSSARPPEAHLPSPRVARRLVRQWLLVVGLFLHTIDVAVPQASREALASWIALDAPIGYEQFATDPLLAVLEGWHQDENGNLVRRVGSGTPRRVVACGIDWHGYVVSQIREDGYLRLHQIGRGSENVLWDQAHEGQQVRVLTRTGPLLGVTAVANAHFSPQHRHETAIVTADDLWLDVGAESARDVAALGIRLLDPVIRHLPPWHFGNEAAGPGAGARGGCAALATAAQEDEVSAGETVFVISTQHLLGWVGLGGALVRLGEVDSLTVLGAGEESARDESLRPESFGGLAPVLRHVGLDEVRFLAPAVNSPGALMERLGVAQAESLLLAIRGASALLPSSDATSEWQPAPAPTVRTSSPLSDGLSAQTVALLERLAEAPGVAGHEQFVRALMLEEMPAWARSRAETDQAGNLWVEVGSGGSADVFVAHLDEVGFEIRAIAADGVVSLKARGGSVISAWEGQPARLVSEESAVEGLDGVFLARREPLRKRPESLRAWFGLDGEALRERGVREGLAVTGYKEAHRLGTHRFTARALDDRAGSAALLMALRRIDPGQASRRVIFAWSVREEVGLQGAAALAERFAADSARVFSVDTFVSSDTPLESPHFAFAPLGEGPVLRAAENSSLTPTAEQDDILALARSAGLPLQIGLTQGGTDGTQFTYWGVPNAGLSWPGRYSHSPAEVLDLRDLDGLARLIELLAKSAPN